MTPSTDITPLRDFVIAVTDLVDEFSGNEAALLAAIRPKLTALVEADGWLPDEFARPHPQFYQQYLLHADARERWSLVSFVWGPGQQTPIHDHRVWGLVAVLQGAEVERTFARDAQGTLHETEVRRLECGESVAVSPTLGDIHQVENGHSDRVSISIHVYGANIGAVRRAVYDASTGAERPFVSGYANRLVPNLWDRSSVARGGR